MKQVFDKILAASLAESDRKSWQPQEYVSYEIYFRRNGEWFTKALRQQTNDFPRGVTRSKAKAIAGKTGRVYEVITKRQRVQ